MDGWEALLCFGSGIWTQFCGVLCGYFGVFRDAVCYDAVSNMLIFPEEKHEQSSEPSLLHDTSNISPVPCDSDSCFHNKNKLGITIHNILTILHI